MSTNLYTSNRARLRSAATLTPYQHTKKWMTQYGITCLFTALICILWCGLVLLGSQMALFFGGHYFLRIWDEEVERLSAFTIYNHTVTTWIRIVGFALIIVYMFLVRKRKEKR